MAITLAIADTGSMRIRFSRLIAGDESTVKESGRIEAVSERFYARLHGRATNHKLRLVVNGET